MSSGAKSDSSPTEGCHLPFPPPRPRLGASHCTTPPLQASSLGAGAGLEGAQDNFVGRAAPRPGRLQHGTGQPIALSCPASGRELRVGAWQEVSIQASSTPCSLGPGDGAGQLGSFCELLRALQEAQCRGRLSVGVELAAEVPVALDLDFTLMDAGCLSLV